MRSAIITGFQLFLCDSLTRSVIIINFTKNKGEIEETFMYNMSYFHCMHNVRLAIIIIN